MLWFGDRYKDVIKTGGENVASIEVEKAVYATSPDIAEVVVVGLPHERWTEAITAVVVAKPGVALDAEALRQAIGEHRLEIEYQPVIELASGSVRSVEAVVLWAGDSAEVPAGEFLAVAEETGLIVQLGDWVRTRACRQVAAWRGSGIDVGLAVACTARQFSAPGFVTSVLAALEDADLPAAALTIKVSDQILAAGPPAVGAELAVLRGKGVRLALGSSGIGLISLASLRRSAIDAITIDAACVTGRQADPTLPILVKAIIGLARDLGIEVVADGVERPEERGLLEALGCAFGQGPGLAGMVSAGELEPLPAAQAGDTACSAAT